MEAMSTHRKNGRGKAGSDTPATVELPASLAKEMLTFLDTLHGDEADRLRDDLVLHVYLDDLDALDAKADIGRKRSRVANDRHETERGTTTRVKLAADYISYKRSDISLETFLDEMLRKYVFDEDDGETQKRYRRLIRDAVGHIDHRFRKGFWPEGAAKALVDSRWGARLDKLRDAQTKK